jgi:hypothetical protein
MYTLTQDENVILRDEDQAHIPTDPDNRDYQEFLAWCDEGNEPAPYIPPPVQPMVPPPSDKEMAEEIFADHEQRISDLEGQVERLTKAMQL